MSCKVYMSSAHSTFILYIPVLSDRISRRGISSIRLNNNCLPLKSKTYTDELQAPFKITSSLAGLGIITMDDEHLHESSLWLSMSPLSLLCSTSTFSKAQLTVSFPVFLSIEYWKKYSGANHSASSWFASISSPFESRPGG